MLHGLSYVGEALLPFFGLLLLAYLLAFSQVPVLALLLVPQFFAFLIVLQLSDLFRQRFFLQPRQEWGLHWRAGLLRYARWPYCLLACVDVATNRDIPYELTTKRRVSRARTSMLWPHLLTAVVLGLAWLIGLLLRGQLDLVTQLWALAAIFVSLALFATQFWRFPAPFDPALLSGKTSQWKSLETSPSALGL